MITRFKASEVFAKTYSDDTNDASETILADKKLCCIFIKISGESIFQAASSSYAVTRLV
jgi:hypothetical protein